MKRWVTNLLMIFFAAVFLVSGYFLLTYYLESGKQKNQFDQLAQLMDQATVPAQPPAPVIPTLPGETAPSAPTEPAAPLLVPVLDPETGETVEVLPEFAELYTMNNHIVGWISIEGTNINYPVMQTPDSQDYYLNRDFNREYSRQGCIYIREACDVFAPSDNLTIYGHRMGDGTMFNDLHKYLKKDFWEEHRYITFNTLTQRSTYEIICIFRIESTKSSSFLYHLFVDAADRDQFDAYLQNCRNYAVYDTGLSASYGDKLITLSTCEYTRVNGRLVVVARRLPDSENTP